jgi:hypothetical protein
VPTLVRFGQLTQSLGQSSSWQLSSFSFVWLTDLFLAKWMESVGTVDDRNAKRMFRVLGDVDNPAEAAILGSNRNDYFFHCSVHHSHSYLSILVALSHNIQEVMTIGKVDTSRGNSVTRTHRPTFDGGRADNKLCLTKGRDCHFLYQV